MGGIQAIDTSEIPFYMESSFIGIFLYSLGT